MFITNDNDNCNPDTVEFAIGDPINCCKPECPPDTAIDCGVDLSTVLGPTMLDNCGTVTTSDEYVASTTCPTTDVLFRTNMSSILGEIGVQTIVNQDTAAPVVDCSAAASQPVELGCQRLNFNPADVIFNYVSVMDPGTCSLLDNTVSSLGSNISGNLCFQSDTLRVIVSDSCENKDSCDVVFTWIEDDATPQITCNGGSDSAIYSTGLY